MERIPIEEIVEWISKTEKDGQDPWELEGFPKNWDRMMPAIRDYLIAYRALMGNLENLTETVKEATDQAMAQATLGFVEKVKGRIKDWKEGKPISMDMKTWLRILEEEALEMEKRSGTIESDRTM